jgi:hypothetical protein
MDELTADVTFTRAIALPEPPSFELLRERNLFDARASTGMLRRLGAPLEDSLVPHGLRPSNVVEQEVARRLKAAGVAIEGSRMPFKWFMNGAPVELDMTLRVFPPKIATVAVRVRGLALNEDSLTDQLLAVQTELPRRVTPLLQESLAVMLATGDHRATTAPGIRLEGRTAPATHVRVGVERSAIGDWAQAHAKALAAALIRDGDHETTDPQLFADLFARNRQLNLKGGVRRLLDKQGGLLVSSFVEPGRAQEEFNRLGDLQTMALVLRQFFGMYSRDRAQAPAYYDFLLSKAMHWVEDEPTGEDCHENWPAVLRDSVTSRHAWGLLVKEVGLVRDGERLMGQTSVAARVAAVREHAGALDSDWWDNPDLVHELDQVLKDQTPPQASGGMTQYIQIQDAAQIQIAAGDINNYKSFDELGDALSSSIDGLTNIDDDAKDEARGLVSKIFGKGDAVATSAAGSAGGAVLGSVLKQLLGLP